MSTMESDLSPVAEGAEARLSALVTRFETANRSLAGETRLLLDRIVADTRKHARLVNTLSLLEHIGSHKIMATQHAAGIDQATLRHIAEEAHHAYFMKRQAEKTAARPLQYAAADLLAPATARMYFQRLEATIVHALGTKRSTRAAYLYMSLFVEFRALWFYRLYQAALQRARHPLSLKRLLGEEESHLRAMAQRLELDGELGAPRTAELLRREESLYRRLLSAMTLAIA